MGKSFRFSSIRLFEYSKPETLPLVFIEHYVSAATMNITRVLVIDNDYDSAYCINSLLQRLNIGCRLALSLSEAQSILGEESNLSVVFQEISMPHPPEFSLSGWVDLIKSKNLGLVAVSSLDRSDIYEYCGGGMFDMMVQKPVHFFEIYEALEYAGISVCRQENGPLNMQAC